MDKLKEEEKEQALREFDEKQRKQYLTGKIIVFSLATLNIICAVISLLIYFSIISLLIQIVLSLLLYMGISVVRYLFAVGYALNAINLLYVLALPGVSQGISAPVVIMVFADIVFCIVSSIVLFKNKSVGEFLYSQEIK